MPVSFALILFPFPFSRSFDFKQSPPIGAIGVLCWIFFGFSDIEQGWWQRTDRPYRRPRIAFTLMHTRASSKGVLNARHIVGGRHIVVTSIMRAVTRTVARESEGKRKEPLNLLACPRLAGRRALFGAVFSFSYTQTHTNTHTHTVTRIQGGKCNN